MSGVIAPIYYQPPEAMQQAMEVEQPTAPGLGGPMDAKSASRSCTTCSKAKAKCVKKAREAVCERCARLRKECHSREPVLRRRKVVKTTRAAQLEKLENKIEHLVNALATTQSHRGFSVDLGQPSPPISATSERVSADKFYEQQRITDDSFNPRQHAVLSSLCDPIDGREDGCTSSSSSSPTPDPTTASTAATSPVAQLADYQSVGVSMAEADVLLDRYRRLLAPAMPFVVLPPNTTAQQLYAEKPALLHSIVVVSSFHDLAKQQMNVKRLIRNLSERIMINCEKSIDVLQAIMVFVGWYHPHIFWSNQCTNLMHLAIAMIVDLGLDRPPQQCGDFKEKTHKAVNGPGIVERQPLPEEHRILAGIFYLSSCLSSSFKKMDATPYTPYLTNALVTLETAANYESDLLLVQMVRLQHLVEEASGLSAPQAPIGVYTKGFEADLARLRKADPNKDLDNFYLQMQYRTTEVLIWEIALNDLQEGKGVSLRCRLEDLSRLIDAIKNFIDLFFTIDISSYLTMPFSIFAQFAHTFIVLIKIASLEVDGWDIRILSDRINFLESVAEAARRFEASLTSHPDGLDINNDHFGKWAVRIRWMMQVYEAKFVQGEEKTEAAKAILRTPAASEEQFAADTPATSAGGQSMQQPTPPDDVLSGDFFNYLDENFWQSFAGDFDLGYPDVSMV
ncbi:uncharacterized protein LTR77_010365 [Saxophila tyrrhenica]|uniref:Zn(2)-C6 fungal-type domain-containing protein n=1 Tax=Saxophila tyrrhenica TaxID=1690608 RepID=A0AAV9NZP8_9PEZI|nr:hypothetical protein LTR77_010365 [Saxophila tyrrhenica]